MLGAVILTAPICQTESRLLTSRIFRRDRILCPRSYLGSSYYSPSASAALTQVVQGLSAISFGAVPNPSEYGSSVTLTATVAPSTATGSVQFLKGATLLGSASIVSGQAQMSLSTLPVGSNPIIAVYSGDANYLSSTSTPVTQIVYKTGTSVALASSVNPSASGQSVTFTAIVSPNWVSGTVQFLDGATVLGTVTTTSGVAALSLSSLSAGTHSITAVYSGDANIATSTSAVLTQTVNKAASTVSLGSSLNPSPFGQSVTFTAIVSPNWATGTVQFLDGSNALGTVTISAGSAALSLSNLSAGAHSITAVYGGDANDHSSASNAVVETVQKIATTTTFTGWGLVHYSVRAFSSQSRLHRRMPPEQSA